MNPNDAPAPAAGTRLAPSEAVVLSPDAFASKAGFMNSVPRTLGEGKVAARPLAEAVLATAMLANRDAGTLRMEARAKKWLFGLLTRRPLVAEPTGAPADWLEGTLEAAVLRCLGDGEREVADVLHDALEEDVPSPAQHVHTLVRRGLHARGLLVGEKGKVLGFIPTTRLVAAPGLAELAAARGAEAERSRLERCEREEPELWNALRKAIAGALSRRTESDHDTGGDDTDWD